jgi:hypothetical protein
MRHLLSVMLTTTGLVVFGATIGSAQPLMRPGQVLPAPVGHAQPHAQGFAPQSGADRVVQDRLSAEDARQQKLDEMLDKKLNICRNC